LPSDGYPVPTHGESIHGTLGPSERFSGHRIPPISIKEREREHFAKYFEAYFPEAFQQLGAIAAGSFLERKNQSGFTWIRGFHTIEDRAVANAEFYYGSVWKEHKKTLNDLMTDSDNVMLLRPLSPERGVPILPAVDPVTATNGAQDIVVAQIFAIKGNSVEAFAKEAETLRLAHAKPTSMNIGTSIRLKQTFTFCAQH
jgi:hypothetical protein